MRLVQYQSMVIVVVSRQGEKAQLEMYDLL